MQYSCKISYHSDLFVKVLFIMLLLVKWKILLCVKCIHLFDLL